MSKTLNIKPGEAAILTDDGSYIIYRNQQPIEVTSNQDVETRVLKASKVTDGICLAWININDSESNYVIIHAIDYDNLRALLPAVWNKSVIKMAGGHFPKRTHIVHAIDSYEDQAKPILQKAFEPLYDDMILCKHLENPYGIELTVEIDLDTRNLIFKGSELLDEISFQSSQTGFMYLDTDISPSNRPEISKAGQKMFKE